MDGTYLSQSEIYASHRFSTKIAQTVSSGKLSDFFRVAYLFEITEAEANLTEHFDSLKKDPICSAVIASC